MRVALLTAVGGAIALLAAGSSEAGIAPPDREYVRIAQASGTDTPSADPGGTGGADATGPEADGTIMADPKPLEGALQFEPFSEELVGRPVTSAEGDNVGTVVAVAGDRLIVSTGGFLGIGERSIALSRNDVAITGSGLEQTVTLKISEEELRAKPDYSDRAPAAPGEGAEPGTTPEPGEPLRL